MVHAAETYGDMEYKVTTTYQRNTSPATRNPMARADEDCGGGNEFEEAKRSENELGGGV